MLVHRLAKGEPRAAIAQRARIDELRLLTLEEHHDRATADELARLARALGVSAADLVNQRRVTVTLDVVPPEVTPSLPPPGRRRRRAA